MTITMLVAVLLVAAVLLAWWRLFGWWRAVPPGERSRRWRLALLALGQPVAAGLLFLTLFPVRIAAPEPGILIVATRNTPRLLLIAPTADVIALPEARAASSTATAPDLATALRRKPGIGRLRILGEGLEARDIDAARGLTIAFDPPLPPRGLIALAPPGRVAPGGDFRVGGEASGIHGTAELLDPAGARVAIVPLDANGRFVLTGSARVPGLELFGVRLHDARGATVEEAPVPVVTTVDPAPRVLFLAGAPGPEVKYWRRWAIDSGLDVTARQAIGAGLDLGDRVPPLTAAMLARYDLVIVDERSWAALAPGERGALVSGVRGGLGLLLRATGPLPGAVRAAWSALGLPLSQGLTTAPVRSRNTDEPEMTRRVLSLGAPQFVPLLRDDGGAVLAGWRAVGRGRVGIWSVTDDFALVTSGNGERFGSQWADMVGALARARPLSSAQAQGLPQQNVRTTICGIGESATVLAPGGRVTILVPDPAAGGCAGFWPRSAGWHSVRQAASSAFYVYPDAALPAIRATERRDATLSLIAGARRAAAAGTETQRSPSWPWLIAFICVAAGLWVFERSRRGRNAAVRDGRTDRPVDR